MIGDRQLQECDTAIANPNSTDDMVILSKSLLSFPPWISEEKIIRDYHVKILKLINQFFNDERDCVMMSSPIQTKIYERTLSPDDDRGK